MPSFTKDKGGKPKLTDKTENPDQAAEQAKLADTPPAAPVAEPEKK